MNDTVGPQLVLRCAQCNKPFDKGKPLAWTSRSCRIMLTVTLCVIESTLKRHGYYCRSKKTGPVPRVRSCGSCAKLKAACDKRRPKCSRCATKGLSCHYPVKAAANTNSTSRKYSNIDHQVTLVTPSAAGSPPVTSEMIGQESSNDSAVAFDNVPFPDIDFSSLGDNPLDWQLGGTDDLTGFWDENMNIQTFQANQSSNSTTPGSHDSVPLTDRDIQSYAPLPVSIPRTPGPGIRSLVPRTKTKTHAQRIANLILQTVRSYPLTILNNNGLPPFIHPSLITPGVDNPDMEPLTNCISLVRMLNNGFQGSRKLFWKNVRLECERLCEPVCCSFRQC